MKQIVWEIKYHSYPPAFKYCPKCGRKTEFLCSGQFRINAQRRSLDIWLIYKCSVCNTTWNAAVYSRISPQSLNAAQLERFHGNDSDLAAEYAMDIDFLHRNGAETGLAGYSIVGDSFCLDDTDMVKLKIKTEYFSPLKVSALMREKLHLSKRAYLQLIADGKMKCLPEQDLQGCKLRTGITLMFNSRKAGP